MAPASRSLFVLASLLSAASAGIIRGQSSTATIPLGEIAPSNTGAAALPTPTVQPKVVALGLGYQNYTCTNTTTSSSLVYVQTQLSDGAVASLYDITHNLDNCNVDYVTPEALGAFETCVIATKCNPTKNDCQACHDVAASVVRQRGILPLRQVGEHFFAPINGSQTPNFNLYAYDLFLSGKKVGDVKAPANASHGASGYGAVDWLYLVNNGNKLNHGLSAVYRIETAGGAAPKNCSTVGETTFQPYAAQYWFYT